MVDDPMAIATLAGQTVVTAAVTDAWEGLRTKIARLFGRHQPETQIERRLDATRQQLIAAAQPELAQAQGVQAEAWKVRFADLLADCPEAADELDVLLEDMSSKMPASMNHSVAAGRDITASAEHGSAAAVVVHGNIALGPTMPGPEIS